MQPKKVLVLAYYWPPSGGAGVQRWLKLSKYLAKSGVEVHVVTVDEKYASYTDHDKSLLSDIHPDVKVHKTKSIEPNNLYGRIFGKDKIPKGGFSNVDKKSKLQQFIIAVRSHLFIPDPRMLWNVYAYRKAIEVIDQYSIKNVITTSPPHSTQLIGLKLKKNRDIYWISDLRDPWTDIYYYDILNHSRFSHNMNKRHEKSVVESCDHLITVSQGVLDLYKDKTKQDIDHKSSVIPNGYDHKDFENIKVTKNRTFTIIYTGTMSKIYHPEVFFEVMGDLKDTYDFRINLVGNIDKSIIDFAFDLGLTKYVDYRSTVPHDEVVQLQKAASSMLLVIPDVDNFQGILTGKLFEYMASENPIICIVGEGSDTEKIIIETDSGYCFRRSQKEKLKKRMISLLEDYKLGIERKQNEKIKNYSREAQAAEIKKILKHG